MNEIEQKWAACIVYYQDRVSLNNLLESLENQSLKPSEVFIADNNSNEPVKINNYSFPVNVSRLAQNMGFAGGANVAVNKAMENNFNNFILLSQDVLLENNAAEKIIEKLTENSGIVFPTMIFFLREQQQKCVEALKKKTKQKNPKQKNPSRIMINILSVFFSLLTGKKNYFC